MVSGRRAKRSRTAAAAEEEEFDDLALAIEKVQEVQDELDQINEEANHEILAMEKKYDQIRDPFYVRRDKILSGIPDFWSTSLLSHPTIEDLLNMDDREIFKYLDTLHVENFKDERMGYCITFNFKPNPYFDNTKLTKTMEFFDNGTLKSTGTTIRWKPGKGPSDISNYMKERNKRSSSPNSFFDWFEFRPEYTLEVDRDPVAELIKEEIWANPIEHLNNVDDDDDDDDDGTDDDDDDTDNDEDYDGENEDTEEDDEDE
ncbi:NAP1-related protein 2 [Striga hermonthica]|uniref:NAP1-related protein 2 n=1 Tax=Striga hermonthica TaxID=68872 RepID=A0A9N7NDA9_STRHE|nr:NAP1-related protein 2 [Striga hermonthica]